ncbi:hypothetical protein [uncultured Pseudoflavonifractor sp.]|uniref:hypothetical protein n=1 Tax=uncultured Pseudoflavonifractor sp. TaxID=1221379 RepID=UPI0025F38999|nr:hypothetical protein [uncultured Pseudoflavonifractor sp.]
MKVYHKRGGNATNFRWIRVPFCALLAVMALGTVGNIECGFVSVRAGAVTLAALMTGLAVALAWPERRGMR